MVTAAFPAAKLKFCVAPMKLGLEVSAALLLPLLPLLLPAAAGSTTTPPTRPAAGEEVV